MARSPKTWGKPREPIKVKINISQLPHGRASRCRPIRALTPRGRSAGRGSRRLALILPPGKYALVPTGLTIALPPGFEAQVRPRSGLAAKHGVTVLNSPGTIDADYRGEIGVL